MFVNKRVIVKSLLPRVLILIVAAWNILCAIQFIVFAKDYAPSFDLTPDITGKAVIQSIGVLFIMWNIPYIFAIFHPHKWFILLICALLMQLTGLIGEIWIKSQLTLSYNMVSSIQRFIVFDAIGLVLIFTSALLVWAHRRNHEI